MNKRGIAGRPNGKAPGGALNEDGPPIEFMLFPEAVYAGPTVPVAELKGTYARRRWGDGPHLTCCPYEGCGPLLPPPLGPITAVGGGGPEGATGCLPICLTSDVPNPS